MVRVHLTPLSGILITVVDIVTEGLLQASIHRRMFTAKARIVLVLAELHRLSDAHCVDNISVLLLGFRASPNDPVPNIGLPTDLDLRVTRGKSTEAIERVRGEPVVPGHSIGIEPNNHEFPLTRVSFDFSILPSGPIWLSPCIGCTVDSIYDTLSVPSHNCVTVLG